MDSILEYRFYIVKQYCPKFNGFFLKIDISLLRVHEHHAPAGDSIALPVFIFCLTRMKPLLAANGQPLLPKIIEIYKVTFQIQVLNYSDLKTVAFLSWKKIKF